MEKLNLYINGNLIKLNISKDMLGRSKWVIGETFLYHPASPHPSLSFTYIKKSKRGNFVHVIQKI